VAVGKHIQVSGLVGEMNKRQVKKYLRKATFWEPISDNVSYLKLDPRANNKHVQRRLRKVWGGGVWWYQFTSPIKGVIIPKEMDDGV